MPLTPESSYTEIFQHLSEVQTTSVCDAHPEVRLMDRTIDPLVRGSRCTGLAYTVHSTQDSLSIMQALDDLQDFLLSRGLADDPSVPVLLVIASCGAPYALVGDMCAKTAKVKGFEGVITDGYYRDIKETTASGLSVFGTGKHAKSGPKDKVGTRREPIVCGDVAVNPYDIVLADDDGVVVMSREEAIPAINKAMEIQRLEKIAEERVRDGARFNEICNIDEHVERLQQGLPSKLEMTL